MLTATEKTQKQTLKICDCGLADFKEILQQQYQLRDKRYLNEITDTVLIAEHHPVITLGARQTANKLLVSRSELEKQQIDLVDIRRGGGATAHNLGQLVFYPILNLHCLGLGIKEYITKLEAIGIELLKLLGVNSQRRNGFPGLWVGDRKIASIGVRVSKFVTYHGMAINIQNNLSIFDYIIPCGLNGIKMTSVYNETAKSHSMQHVKQKLAKLLIKHFSSINKRKKLPSWLHRPLPAGEKYNYTKNLLNSLCLETICTNANCPNRSLCWARATATVLILGNICTRNCKFCSVPTGKPNPPDPTEPLRIAELAKQMKLKYLVITSVTRDDLPDGGAAHFRNCIKKVRQQCPDIKFEILTPDFKTCLKPALTILKDALPFVFAHNVETVPSLYSVARPGADYKSSLKLLKMAKKSFDNIQTKSSIMLGLGENDDEIEQVLKDLRNAGCDRITIGQYLKPSNNSLDVIEYVKPEKFDYWKQKAVQLGFTWVISSPFARSSYLAEQENTLTGMANI